MYKTIVLDILQTHPLLHSNLRLSRKLMSEMERYARDLRASHQRWKNEGMEPSGAMELAVHEIEERIAQEAARLEA